MKMRIGGQNVEEFNDFSMKVKRDSIASSFGVAVRFDPDNDLHKEIVRPGAYHRTEITDKGDRLLTGYIVSQSFTSKIDPSLVALDGYTLTGVLDDCEIPLFKYPIQHQNLSIRQIFDRVLEPFGLRVEVEPQAQGPANEVVDVSSADANGTVTKYLSDIASQKDLILSHNEIGDVVLSKGNPDAFPVARLDQDLPELEAKLDFDGASMHDTISVQKQQSSDGGNSGVSIKTNPFVKAFRPHVTEQNSGDDNDTGKAAVQALNEEIKNIKLQVDLDRWRVNGTLLWPGQLIELRDPRLYLYDPTRWLINEVSFQETIDEKTASINCVLPQVYEEQSFNVFP